MLIGERNRLPHPDRLLKIARPVWPQQCQVTLHGGIGRIDVAKNLRPRGLYQTLLSPNIELGARLLALVAIENAQRNSDANTEKKWDRRIARDVQAEGWIR